MDKSILNIETVSNADIQNAEFYIAVNLSLIHIFSSVYIQTIYL